MQYGASCLPACPHLLTPSVLKVFEARKSNGNFPHDLNMPRESFHTSVQPSKDEEYETIILSINSWRRKPNYSASSLLCKFKSNLESHTQTQTSVESSSVLVTMYSNNNNKTFQNVTGGKTHTRGWISETNSRDFQLVFALPYLSKERRVHCRNCRLRTNLWRFNIGK